jgi:two-component system, chemotaxis family, chemotaxis protein CheY
MPFNLSDKSILLVDDSSIMRMFMALNMRRLMRVNITEAVNGQEAVSKLMNGKFDLLLTDMNMPGMGGAELVRFVRNGLKSDMPIVIITTMGGNKDRDLGMKLGANAYLTKPVDVTELVKTILSCLGKYSF